MGTACASECSEENDIPTANAELFSRVYLGLDYKKQMFTWAGDIEAWKNHVDKILTSNRFKCSIAVTDLPQSRRNQSLSLFTSLQSRFKSKDPMLWLLKLNSDLCCSSLALPNQLKHRKMKFKFPTLTDLKLRFPPHKKTKPMLSLTTLAMNILLPNFG